MRALVASAVALGLSMAGGQVHAQQDATFRPQVDRTVRFRLLPPYARPDFVGAPVPPPDKSYLIPLGEVLLLDTMLWGADYATGKPYAKISFSTIGQQFTKGWILDTDDFWANGMLHPMHGAFNYNAARSTGLGFYESFGYAFLGSAIWEQFLENLPPSINDQIYSPFGGTLLGESLYRMSRLVLDSGGYKPSPLREFFSFLLSPPAGVNRLMFGDRYRGELLLPASWMGELRAGSVIAGSSSSSVVAPHDTDVGPWASFAADVVYGVPGTPDLSLEHPFDHFTLSTSISLTPRMSVPMGTLLIRGLLLGEPIERNGAPFGLWGLFTSYDFVTPAVFQLAALGVGPGVSLLQRWGSFELHGTVVGEALPWSQGSSGGSAPSLDYHYGPGADLVVELRAHFGDRVVTRLEGREYWITGAYDRGGSEAVSFARAQMTVRLFGVNGISGALDWGHRRALHGLQPDTIQHTVVATLYYTLLRGW